MPKYTNSFRSPDFIEETIVDADNAIVGTIRVKPAGILWKPKSQHKYLSVSLEKFTDWITDPGTRARLVKS